MACDHGLGRLVVATGRREQGERSLDEQLLQQRQERLRVELAHVAVADDQAQLPGRVRPWR